MRVQPAVDGIEREAFGAEGYDPDDPAVLIAIDFVRSQLSLEMSVVRTLGT